ncbi:MAG: hypothetical protein ACK4SA_25905, partial [Caldilinea sp.]
AQVIGTITPGGTVAAPNGGNICADGTTVGGYTTVFPNTHPNPLVDISDSPYDTASTICTNQDVTQSYNTSVGPAPTTFNGDAATTSENGSATSTYVQVTETTQAFDTNTDPATADPGNPYTQVVPLTSPTPGNYSYTESLETDQQNLYQNTTSVSGTGSTGTGSQSEGWVNSD